MKPHKILFTAAAVFLTFQLTGCAGVLSGSGRQPLTRDAYLSGTEDEQADEMMGRIARAMDSEDADALKGLFSEYAVGVTPDLDNQIEELFDFYEGPSVSYDGKSDYSDGRTSYAREESGNPSWGHAYELIGGRYTMKTAEEIYQVKIDFYAKNEESPDKVGLSILEVVAQDYYDQDGFMMQAPDADPGIYVYGDAGSDAGAQDDIQVQVDAGRASSGELSAFASEAFGEQADNTEGRESASWTFEDCIERIGHDVTLMYYGDGYVRYTWKASDNESAYLRLYFKDTDNDGIYTLYSYEAEQL